MCRLAVMLLAAMTASWPMAATMDSSRLDPAALARWWRFDDPAGSEATFRIELAKLPADSPAYLELLTQIARAQGLQRQFEAANATLDRVAPRVANEPPRVEARYLLERGRVFNSSHQAAKAVPLFRVALDRAHAAQDDYLAIDAAHMLGIATPPSDQVKWNLEAVAMAEQTADPRAKSWLPKLYNNIGWALHDAGDYAAALDYFRRALAGFEAAGSIDEIRIARWSVARALRSLKRYDEAMAMQEALLTEFEASGDRDGYVYEELAELHLARGEQAAARVWFAKAYATLSLDPSFVADEPARLERMRKLAEAS